MKGPFKALATILAATAIASPSAATMQETQSPKTVVQKEAVQERKKIARQSNLPIEIGGIPMETYFHNPGISPKEYGMFRVKRGTHKKSNKK